MQSAVNLRMIRKTPQNRRLKVRPILVSFLAEFCDRKNKK